MPCGRFGGGGGGGHVPLLPPLGSGTDFMATWCINSKK